MCLPSLSYGNKTCKIYQCSNPREWMVLIYIKEQNYYRKNQETIILRNEEIKKPIISILFYFLRQGLTAQSRPSLKLAISTS
jgi:hypothetical protein